MWFGSISAIVIGAAVTTVILVSKNGSSAGTSQYESLEKNESTGSGESVSTSESQKPVEPVEPVEDEFRQPQEEIDSFKEEIGGCSDTYEGALSETEYDNAENAAKDYVKYEVVGTEKTGEISDVKTKDLKLSDAEKLGINAGMIEGATGIKECTVTYTEKAADVSKVSASEQPELSLLSETAVNKTTKVYIICFGGYYKYFSPALKTGETVTKSYFDSIFNASKYDNCTVEYSAVTKTSLRVSADVMKDLPADQLPDDYEGGDYESVMTETRINQFVQYTENAIYYKQTLGMPDPTSETGEIKETTVELYFEKNASAELGFDFYAKNGTTWAKYTDITALGFESIDDLRPFHQQYIDYSYFTKTEFGCAIQRENLEIYMNGTIQALKEAAKAMGAQIDGLDITFHVNKGYLNYFVKEGTLSGMKSCFECSVPFNVNGMATDIVVYTDGTTKCFNYGTTEITRPEGI